MNNPALINLIRKTYVLKEQRRWDRIYWCIDLHDVIIEGKYNKYNEGRELAPFCAEVFQILRSHDENCTILWTSSHGGPIIDMRSWLSARGVTFDYINANPECADNELCAFGSKFYFNVLLDDKSGFSWRTDWKDIYDLLVGEIYK